MILLRQVLLFVEPAFSFMKVYYKGLILVLFLSFFSFLLPLIIEYSHERKEPNFLEAQTYNLLLKGTKLKIDLEECYKLFWRGKKQIIFQRNKFFLLRDFNYSNNLLQKSFDIAIKKIKDFKKRERLEEEELKFKMEETNLILSQIKDLLEKIPLGSDCFNSYLLAHSYIKEAENFIKLKRKREALKCANLSFEKSEEILFKIQGALKEFYSPEKLAEWKSLHREALNSSFKGVTILVVKDERLLYLLKGGRVFKTYSVEFGKNPLEKKLKSGDLATPEGKYKITMKKGFGKTKYYLALLLNYPNEEDKRRFEEAKRKGIIPHNVNIGGLIEIHGDGGLGIDWTEGCVALENGDMKELYDIVSVNTPVYIIGSLGRNDAMSNLLNSKVWKNLKKS